MMTQAQIDLLLGDSDHSSEEIIEAFPEMGEVFKAREIERELAYERQHQAWIDAGRPERPNAGMFSPLLKEMYSEPVLRLLESNSTLLKWMGPSI